MANERSAYRDIHARLMRQHNSERGLRLQFEGEWFVFHSLETRYAGDDYYWRGMHRGADPNHPYLIFQFTLDGCGAFEHGGRIHRLEPGKAFAALTPAEYSYYLPRDTASWTFFWLSIHHPYIVSRLTAQIAETGPVLNIPPDARLLTRSLEIWEQIQVGNVRDNLTYEQLLFDWMFEFERFCHGLKHPQAERDRWLQDARQFVSENLQSSCSVEKLAAKSGLSRSHYSHLFKSATGLSPAVWVHQVRLEEVARRLTSSDDTLQKIAGEAGYGDANHLCKVFRRYFHLSPNQFRRQMR